MSKAESEQQLEAGTISVGLRNKKSHTAGGQSVRVSVALEGLGEACGGHVE